MLSSLTELLKKPRFDIHEKSTSGLASVVYVQSGCNPPSDRDEYITELMKYVRVDSYFSNETVSRTIGSTGPMKMFCLERETMNVCQRNVARFGHVECRFDKINDIFQGFGNCCHCDFRKMEALKVNKFGQTYRTGTQAAQAIIVRS